MLFCKQYIKWVVFVFYALQSSRLLKLGKLAEYFSIFYRFRCHYPLITYLRENHKKFNNKNVIKKMIVLLLGYALILITYQYFYRTFQILPIPTPLVLLGQHHVMELRSVLMVMMKMDVRLHLGFCLQSYLELDLSYGVLCFFTQSNVSIM